MKLCTVPGCGRRHRSLGYCGAHAERVRRTGNPGIADIGPNTRGRLLAERLWSRVELAGPDDCWEWTASRLNRGYGSFAPGMVAHRVAYEITYGPIPPGLYVMHTCDNPPCSNPRHLRVGTPQENVDDMVAKGRSRWQ